MSIEAMKQSDKDACTKIVIQAISEITQVESENISQYSVLASAPLNMDQLDLVELALNIESRTNIKICPDWFDYVKTINDVVLKIQPEIGK